MPETPTVDCTPAALIEAAKCYKCISPGLQGPVMIWLLQQIAGNTMTPAQLMDEARCLKCVSPGMQAEVMIFLLCKLLQDIDTLESAPDNEERPQ